MEFIAAPPQGGASNTDKIVYWAVLEDPLDTETYKPLMVYVWMDEEGIPTLSIEKSKQQILELQGEEAMSQVLQKINSSHIRGELGNELQEWVNTLKRECSLAWEAIKRTEALFPTEGWKRTRIDMDGSVSWERDLGERLFCVAEITTEERPFSRHLELRVEEREYVYTEFLPQAIAYLRRPLSTKRIDNIRTIADSERGIRLVGVAAHRRLCEMLEKTRILFHSPEEEE